MKRSHQNRNILLYDSSEGSADILYATGFSCPDPFIFIRTTRGRRILVMSDLEIDRARAQSNAHRVLPLAKYVERAREKRKKPHIADVIVEVLRELRIRSVVVPERFPIGLADRLRKARLGVTVAPSPFFPERQIKSEVEVRAIRRTMKITEEGMAAGVELLRRSRIRNGWVMWKGRRLTVEVLRRAINEAIFSRGCVPAHTIVAPGKQGCDPHDVGSGPIRANQSIIIDIFPRSEKSGYFGDITRTFVKGSAPEKVKIMFNTVLAAQRLGLRMTRAGTHVREIHRAIHELFASRGFATGRSDGRMQGFFHGTGHGLGLEIHEPPRIGDGPGVLRAGMVVTVEPGLYYYPTGGVRIEDTVLVTGHGVRNLTRFSKFLEIP